MNSKATVILAAGKGTRMKSRLPKVLHRLCGREMISLVAGAAKGAGFEPTVVVVPPDSQAIRETLEDAVSYAVQWEPMGSGHALLQAQPCLEMVGTVVVLSGDVPLIRPETLSSMMQAHTERDACITLLTARVTNPEGLGRIIRDASGCITAIVEESDTDTETRALSEVNGGIYCFRSLWLWPSLATLRPTPSGEVYLTDLVSLASRQGRVVASVQTQDPEEVLGVNTRVELAQAEASLQQRIRERWMLSGVTMTDPAAVYIDLDAALGQDGVIYPNTRIIGASHIGRECEIGPNTIIDSSEIGNSCRIVASVIESATLEDGVEVGPFSHIRPGSHLERDVHIGNFAEVKGSRLGRGTKSGHFSYIGDAEVGANVNIGAGTVTCNFDGKNKHRTRIEDDAFIGSDSILVAPVTIGARSSTGAGSVVTKDVPADSVAAGVPARFRRKNRPHKREGSGV